MLSRRSLLGSIAVAAALGRTLHASTGAPWLTPDGKIRIVGYNDMDEMLRAICGRFSARQEQARFEFDLRGTKAAPEALARGRSLLAPMGAEMLPHQLAAYRRFRSRDPVMFRVAIDSLDPRAKSSPTAIFVHRDNPLASISLERLKSVFTGNPPAVATWGGLGLAGGWANRPIRALGLAEGTAIGTLLRLQKLGGAAFGNHVASYSQSHDVVAALGRESDGIAFANLNHATSQVRAIAVAETESGPAYEGNVENLRGGLYPLGRSLLIYLSLDHHGQVEPLAAALLRLALSPEGQELVGAGSLGYIPLSSSDAARELEKLARLPENDRSTLHRATKSAST